MNIDEMTNDDLERRGHSDHVLRYELDRVEALCERLCLTGADLSYWYDRARILRRLIGGGTRAVGL